MSHRFRSRHALLSTAAIFFFSTPAFAQQASQAISLDAITVTAVRAERPLSDVPQSVQIIGEAEIQEQLKQSGSASAVLARLVPGFSVSNQTVSCASETYRGRDLLVLLDGVPLNTPLRDVARILSLIDLNSVERIEVVSGASSLYGAGATGGTVNFITKKAEAGPARVTVNTAVRAFTKNIGKSLAPELSLGANGTAPNGIDYVFVGTGKLAGRTYDGAGRELPSDPMLGQGGGDRFQSLNLFGKVGHDFADGKRLEFSATSFYFDQKPDYLTDYSGAFASPDFSSPYTGESVLEDTKSLSLRYSDQNFLLGSLNVVGFYNDIKKRFNYSEFSFPYNAIVYYSYDPLNPTSPANQTTLHSNRGGVNLTIDTPLDAIWAGAKLTWGGDYIQEKTWQVLTTGEDVFTPLSQTTLAGFGLLQVPVTDKLTVRGGARWENFALDVDSFVRPAAYAGIAPGFNFVLPPLNVIGGSYEYSATTFNLGATYKLNENAELFGGFSEGFALPDVGAYTRRAGLSAAYACPVAIPNCLPPSRQTISFTSIAPEAQIVKNYELGIRGAAGVFRGSLTGFVSTSDQGVTFDPTTNLISQQKEKIYGVEFVGEWAATQSLTLGTVLGYREGRYDSDKDGHLDSWLPNNRIATPYRGTFYADYLFDNGVKFRAEVEAWSDRNQPIDLAGTRYKIERGATMNLALSVPVSGGEGYIAVNNLFDTELQNPTGSSVRNQTVYSWGRTVSVGYRKTF
jgi:iron complex outermembrane receptor protein